MEPQARETEAEAFAAFYTRFAPLFPRVDIRRQAAKYVHGLLTPGRRKNGWYLANIMGDTIPDATQRLLYKAQWEADAVRDALQRWVIETWGTAQAVVVIGETAWCKKGKRSVGVHRHLNRITGKLENGQVALFLSYHARRTPVLLDRRLFLPQAWCQDVVRRRQAKVPEDVVFQEKPGLALAMLGHAWQWHVPMAWVVGDAVYGDVPQLRRAVAEKGYQYVLAVLPETLVWPTRPLEYASQISTVAAVIATLPPEQWTQVHLRDSHDYWTALRVAESWEGKPGSEVSLIARRGERPPAAITYYLSNAPRGTAREKLALIASAQSAGDRCLEAAQREVGLADYEVRSWHSWHRHVTLAMLAYAWQSMRDDCRHTLVQRRGTQAF
jgi:SRSO17 transposase